MKRVSSKDTDARVIKTREKLRTAALQLASSTPLEQVTVTELCRLAQVDRATFYRHWQSPLAILSEALVENLDSMRDSFLGEAKVASGNLHQLWVTVTRGTVKHIREFEAVYRAGFSEGADGSLENLFNRHVKQSMRQLLTELPEILHTDPETDPEFIVEAMSASLAGSLTAILHTWVNSSRHSEDDYVTAVLLALPAWMQTSGQGQALSQR